MKLAQALNGGFVIYEAIFGTIVKIYGHCIAAIFSRKVSGRTRRY